MPRHETEAEAKQRREVERLVESVESGAVDAIEDLSASEIGLLLTRAKPGESLEDLFDRLRPGTQSRD